MQTNSHSHSVNSVSQELSLTLRHRHRAVLAAPVRTRRLAVRACAAHATWDNSLLSQVRVFALRVLLVLSALTISVLCAPLALQAHSRHSRDSLHACHVQRPHSWTLRDNLCALSARPASLRISPDLLRARAVRLDHFLHPLRRHVVCVVWDNSAPALESVRALYALWVLTAAAMEVRRALPVWQDNLSLPMGRPAALHASRALSVLQADCLLANRALQELTPI